MKKLREHTIDQFLTNLKKNDVECHAIVILQNHRILLDQAYQPFQKDALHPLYSVSKSFTSIAVGFLIEDGKIRLDDPWLQYFPEYRSIAVPGFATVTIRHLLTMTLGQDGEPVICGHEDWLAAIVSRPLVHPPGTVFFYDSMCSHLLSCLVQRVTGIKLAQYLQPRLFQPLGIRNYVWEEDWQGHTLGGLGLHLRTADLAKFGECLLQEGKSAGRQIIPADWIRQATAKQTENAAAFPAARSEDRQGYGYQFWRCTHHAFRCSGLHGQLCFVQPENQLVIAMASAATGSQAILNCLFDAMDHPVPTAAFHDFAIPLLTGRQKTGFWPAHDFFGTHAAMANPAGITCLRITRITQTQMRMSFSMSGRRYSFLAACGTWLPQKNRFAGFSEFCSHGSIRPQKPGKAEDSLFGNYAWLSDTRLQVQLRALDHSCRWNFLFQLDSRHLTMLYQVSALLTALPTFETVFLR